MLKLIHENILLQNGWLIYTSRADLIRWERRTLDCYQILIGQTIYGGDNKWFNKYFLTIAKDSNTRRYVFDTIEEVIAFSEMVD